MRLGSWTTCAALVAVSLALNVTDSKAQIAPTETPTPVTLTNTPTPTPTSTPVAPTSTPTPALTPTVVPTPFSSGVPCATDDPSTRRVERSERRGQNQEGEGQSGGDDEFATGNGRNEVVVHNCTDSRLRVRASIQLNTIPGRVVAPLNVAYAEGSCVECNTLAVALQVDLYSGARAREVRPENYAAALNTGCTRCVTVARAIQYVQAVEDPRDVAKDVSDTVEALDEELRAIQGDRSISLAEAEVRLNAVLDRFNALGGTLGEQRDERDD